MNEPAQLWGQVWNSPTHVAATCAMMRYSCDLSCVVDYCHESVVQELVCGSDLDPWPNDQAMCAVECCALQRLLDTVGTHQRSRML